MNATTENSKIETYLERVRIAMRELPAGEVEDVLRELRSHIADLSGSDDLKVDTALQSLGDPVELARKYNADHEMARAECSGSPLAILLGLRHTNKTHLGQRALTALYAFGYFVAFGFVAMAIEKALSPAKVGLWYTPGNIWSLRWVTHGDGPANGRELLNWWFVPLTLLIGWLLRYGTDRIALWWIRRYRRDSVRPGL